MGSPVINTRSLEIVTITMLGEREDSTLYDNVCY